MTLPAVACTNSDYVAMRTYIDNPLSRAELGISGDMRKLGVGAMRLRYGIDPE